MGVFQEFKSFAMRGNLVETALAFVMGAAFGKVVSSFIDGMVMPAIGMLTGGIDFNDRKLVIKQAIEQVKQGDTVVVEAAPEVAIKYGTFITNVFDFLVVAFVIFLVVRTMNAARKKEEAQTAAPAAPPAQEVLLTEIRDLLKK
jgi:large conductance mechanosensitive channel